MTVAQLVERRPVEANVAGSNPVSHPLEPLDELKRVIEALCPESPNSDATKGIREL